MGLGGCGARTADMGPVRVNATSDTQAVLIEQERREGTARTPSENYSAETKTSRSQCDQLNAVPGDAGWNTVEQ